MLKLAANSSKVHFPMGGMTRSLLPSHRSLHSLFQRTHFNPQTVNAGIRSANRPLEIQPYRSFSDLSKSLEPQYTFTFPEKEKLVSFLMDRKALGSDFFGDERITREIASRVSGKFAGRTVSQEDMRKELSEILKGLVIDLLRGKEGLPRFQYFPIEALEPLKMCLEANLLKFYCSNE